MQIWQIEFAVDQQTGVGKVSNLFIYLMFSWLKVVLFTSETLTNRIPYKLWSKTISLSSLIVFRYWIFNLQYLSSLTVSCVCLQHFLSVFVNIFYTLPLFHICFQYSLVFLFSTLMLILLTEKVWHGLSFPSEKKKQLFSLSVSIVAPSYAFLRFYYLLVRLRD